MLKYLSLSFLINLFLFSLYSYWVGNALLNAFKESAKFITPLVVNIKTEIETPPKKRAKTKGTVKKEEPSLLENLMPLVENYKLTFKRIVTKARAELTKGGKVKLLTARKIVYIPPVKPIKVEFPPAPAELKLTVLPDGRVVKAEIVKRSGNLEVDRELLDFAKCLRFQPINEPVIQEIYIEFRFRF